MMGSDYMHWAKTGSSARFNLAVSGMLDLPFSDLKLNTEELKNLELTRGGGYGYAPLQEALAARLGVGADSIVAATGTSLANHLAMAALPALVAVACLLIFVPFRVRRLITFLDPWADPQGSGFQVVQSLIAVGSGGANGLGFAQGKQKMLFLPFAHSHRFALAEIDATHMPT